MRARLTRPRSADQSANRSADRGSVSLWLVIFTFVTLALLILVVDGGQVIEAKSRAADIAEQAARAAADDINSAALRSGQVSIEPDACDPGGPAYALITTYGKGVGVTVSALNCQLGTDAAGDPDVTAQVQVQVRMAIPAPLFRTVVTVQAAETAYLACGTADARTAC